MTYKQRLNNISKNRPTARLIKRRLIAKGKTRGISDKHIQMVLTGRTVDEDVLSSAEEIVEIDKDFDRFAPISLMNRAALINHIFDKVERLVA